jgi:hypothetical protein
MTLYEFRSLTEEQQAEAVWNGVFLDLRAYLGLNILLYAIDEFYVEVYYSPSLNKIEGLRPFRSTKPLEPYLAQFNTDELDEMR